MAIRTSNINLNELVNHENLALIECSDELAYMRSFVSLSSVYKKVDSKKIHVAVHVCLKLDLTHMRKVPKSQEKAGYRCVSDCRSRGREFDPGPVRYFHGD